MRNLNLDELTDKISDYSSDIEYSDKLNIDYKLNQFINFLLLQPISARILERISEDFSEIKIIIKEHKESKNWNRDNSLVIDLLKTREIQGAFAYFEIFDMYTHEKKYSNHYIQLSDNWYKHRGDFDKMQEYFIDRFFNPFKELIEWYVSESIVSCENDYYSREEIASLDEKFVMFEQKLKKLGFGQEIIFNETDEIKELIKGLNKKNWTELIKGKLIDLTLAKTITLGNIDSLAKILTE